MPRSFDQAVSFRFSDSSRHDRNAAADPKPTQSVRPMSRRVDVGTNHNMLNTLIHHRPTNGLEAKFSMEFCMAILLVDGKADQTKFTDAVVNRPDVQDMIGRVRFYTDPEAEKAGYDKMTTIIKITSERRARHYRPRGFRQRQSHESDEL